MSSLTSQLLTEDRTPPLTEKRAAPQPAPAGAGEGEQLTPANEAEREALDAAKTAEKLASQLFGQMEKTASSGGRIPDQANEMRVALEKCAHYIPELVRIVQARTKYAEYLLEQAVTGASKEEAFKLASEMVADGILEVPEGMTISDVADELQREGLPTVKKAAEMITSGRFARLGEPDENRKKTASRQEGPIGDSEEEWLVRHDWLLP